MINIHANISLKRKINGSPSCSAFYPWNFFFGREEASEWPPKYSSIRKCPL